MVRTLVSGCCLLLAVALVAPAPASAEPHAKPSDFKCLLKGKKVEGTDFELPCELVLLAMGFVGPERGPMLDQLGVEIDARGNVDRDAGFQTSVEGVFACGDMGRGQSLIVWAIAEGRSCAASVDEWLMGTTTLPAPILPTTRPLV